MPLSLVFQHTASYWPDIQSFSWFFIYPSCALWQQHWAMCSHYESKDKATIYYFDGNSLEHVGLVSILDSMFTMPYSCKSGSILIKSLYSSWATFLKSHLCRMLGGCSYGRKPLIVSSKWTILKLYRLLIVKGNYQDIWIRTSVAHFSFSRVFPWFVIFIFDEEIHSKTNVLLCTCWNFYWRSTWLFR